MDVTFIALGLLACAWAVLLLPDLRNRGGSGGRSNSVKSFRDQLSGLDRTRPSPHGRPASRAGTRPLTGSAERRAGQARGAGAVRPGARPVSARATSGTGLTSPAGPTRPAGVGGSSPRPRRTGAPVAPRSGLVPRSPGQAARRRRVVLLALVGLALVTLAAGLLGPRILLLVHLLVDAALAAYAFLLRERVGRASRGAGLVALHDDDLDDSVLRRKAAGG